MNAPTLIIGLGGKGSEIALKVSKLLSEEQRKQIGFAVFDTDVNELRVIKENNPFVHTIQTSTKLTVGEYLDIDKHARDTWFPVNAILNSKTLTEGAGQVRAVSRMAFETAIRAGKLEELHKAIDELYKVSGEQYQQALRIIIVSSLSGGTGSGLILPVALYVKNYLATRYRQSANITRGFFLLPEVFYGVIPGNAERNNLKCNAYAALREIDSFIMKGDSTLPDKYKDTVKMEFPSVGSNEYEEYSVRPFDFCFLFDAQNSDGNKLNSFEAYLDHAANCIYAMSIGPMNKRSNSSEDNVIRKLCAENGRNRYAGAGTSRLVFPTEDIKEFLALNWTKDAVSRQWLEFDDMYKAQSIKLAKERKKGLRVQDLKESKAYIDAVEQKRNDKDPFAVHIYESCRKYDEDGIEATDDNWDLYIGALRQKIQDENNSSAGDLTVEYSNALHSIENIEPGAAESDWEQYVIAYRAIKKYQLLMTKYVEDSSRTIAFSIFDSDAEGITNTTQNFRLEKYMRNSVGKFIHPNAVRYFLYKVEAAMESEKLLVSIQVNNEKEYFENFEKNTFDNPDTDSVETANTHDLSKTKKVSVLERLSKKLSADQEDLISAYNTYLNTINEYRVNAIYEAVLEEGLSYVRKLCEAFEFFFKSFESKIGSVSQEIDTIRTKYANSKGSTARYVCASPKCMDKFLEKMVYTGGEIEIDSELAEDIYKKVFAFAMQESRPLKTNYFSSIFDDGIVQYFRNKINTVYSADINLDIISAIQRELIYEDDTQEHEPDELEQYVVGVFNEAKVLATPFIEKPLGEEIDPIPACAYNIALNPKDDSPRAKLIDRELKNFGGVADEDVPLNEILFYKSFYGLRVNELSKFAPPQKTVTYNRPSGEYFKAYYELVGKIHPIPSRSHVITPHIDRWWHTVAVMPDLDEDNQLAQEREIYAAFFWSMLEGYVDLFDTGSDQKAYRLQDAEALNMSEDASTLVVSNGTPCDKLYEVLDALSIYPQLVRGILDRVERDLVLDLNNLKDGDEIGLFNALSSFRVREFELGNKESRSMFDLPILLKQSMTTDIYDERKIIELVRVEIDEIKKYLSRFYTEKELADVVGDLLIKQFDKFIDDIDKENNAWHEIYHDYIFTNTCSCVANALDGLGLSSKGKYIRERSKELSK